MPAARRIPATIDQRALPCSGAVVMNIRSFGKATEAIIILTSLGFLVAFASGVPVTPRMMAPWSATAFLITGLTLWVASNPRIAGLGLFRLGAILVFSIGAIVCVEHLAHAGSTAFDELLFPSLLPRYTFLPGAAGAARRFAIACWDSCCF